MLDLIVEGILGDSMRASMSCSTITAKTAGNPFGISV